MGGEKFCGDPTDIYRDPGLACDRLFRHCRGEYWPSRRGGMPPLRRSRSSIPLPSPRDLPVGLGGVVRRRRSVRDYAPVPLEPEDLSDLLYYSAGITGWAVGYGVELPLRATPSAGALQPVEVYVYVGNVRGFEKGIYRYDYFSHGIEAIRGGDHGATLADIALGQDHVGSAPAVFMISVVYRRTFWKYWKRAYRYVLLDAGAVMENLYLVATGLGLGACAVGSFYDEELCEVLGVDCADEFPVVMVTVGRPLEQA